MKRFLLHLLLVALVGLVTAFVILRQVPAQVPNAAPRFAKLDGQRVHYESHGAGREAIVLIHGWTCNLGFWQQQIPDLTKRARVVAIDLPGHGKSDKPKTAYTMDLFARAVNAVMQD